MRNVSSTGLKWLWVTLFVLFIDRYVKYWAIHHLLLGEPLEILPIFNLTLAYNRGAAFSFLHDAAGWQNVFLGGLALIVSLLILVWLYKSQAKEWWMNIALCLILGGALGNALDRVLHGSVVDLFDFHIGNWHFAIFNIADSAITIGAIMLILNWVKTSAKNKKADTVP